MASREKPNIIFILADDLGWGDLGCYGHAFIRTPALDSLAAKGTLLTHFYANGSVCSPSRAAFLTGLFPARTGIHTALFNTPSMADEITGTARFLDTSYATLPSILRDAGYTTAHVGKWHLGAGDAPEVSRYGFDHCRVVNGAGPGWEESGEPSFRARSTELFVDEAIRFIERSRGRPFYLNLWTLIPHATLDPTPEQLEPWRKYGPANVKHAGATSIYYAAVADLDTQIGRLLRRMDALGLSENTLIVFTSDNGPEDFEVPNASHSAMGSPGPFRGRKRSLYEGGVRMPCLLSWPGHIPSGRVDDQSVVSGVDLLPTLGTLAGADVPDMTCLDGEDVRDVLAGRSSARERPLFWEWRFGIPGHVWHRSPQLAVRSGNWKLLMNADGSRKELYDIPADRTEMRDLCGVHPDIARFLSETLLEWKATLPPGQYMPESGRNDYPWPAERP